MAFEGYLIKSGSDIFPHQYIQLKSYSSSPNQVEDVKAFRDDYTRDLYRYVATGRKTSIVFKTRPDLHLAEKQAIQNFFSTHYSVSAERKLSLTYWNDESNTYVTGNFYVANYEFPIVKITNDDIIYDETEFTIVEY